MLVLTIPEYLDELFQYGSLTAVAPLSKLRRVVEMTIDIAFVLVVAVLGAENSRTHGASEVLNVIFPV